MPGGVRHRRVAQCDSTVPREQPAPIWGCGTAMETAPPRTVLRLQSRVATDSGCLLLSSPTRGRNNVFRRGRCAHPLCEAVQDRFGASGGIETVASSQAVCGSRLPRSSSRWPVTPRTDGSSHSADTVFLGFSHPQDLHSDLRRPVAFILWLLLTTETM